MQPVEAQRYCSLMAEIKARSKLITEVGPGRVPVFPQPARVEFVYLQLRKTIELIAMGSLVANARMFAQIQSNIQKYWNAKDLLKDVQAINPDFYPRPVIQKPSWRPGIKMEWLDRPVDFLTKDRFTTLYDVCGSILHARNPFAAKQDFASLDRAWVKWYSRMVNLLNAHVIRLVGDTTLCLIQMGSDTESPTYTLFATHELRPRNR